MITLATITGINTDNNLCTIDVPLLSGTVAQATTMTATMMLPPGIRSGYKTGDVVFISFTENNLGRPIVLGHLYLGALGSGATATADTADLVVCDFLEAKHIKYSAANIDLEKKISNLEDKIKSLETTVESLESTIGWLSSLLP
jgi:hypothetical protein